MKATPEDQIIAAKGSASAYDILDVPCDYQGDFILTNSIHAGDSVRELKQNVQVKKCQNTQLVFPPEDVSGCPCSALDFSFTIKNIGPFTETYEFNMSPYTEDIDFDTQSINLSRGEEKEIHFTSHLPCEVQGSQSLNLIIHAVNNDVVSKVPVFFTVDSCKTLKMDLTAPESMCAGMQESATAVIKNSGDAPLEVDVGSDVDWIRGKENVSIPAERSVQVPLKFMPPVERSGIYDVSISAKRGDDVIVEKAQHIDVQGCYNLQWDVGEVAACAEGTGQASLTLANGGTEDLHLTLAADASWWGPVDNKITLAAGTSKEIPLWIAPKGVTPRITTGILTATNDDGFKVQKEIPLKVANDRDCMLADMYAPLDLKTGRQHAQFPIILKNKGVQTATYSIALDGSDWLKISPTELTVAPGQNGVFYVDASPDATIQEDSYRFTLTATAEDIAYTKSFIIQVKDPSPLWWFAALVIGALILGVAGIIIKRREMITIEVMREEEQNSHPLVWIALVVAVLILAVGSILAYRYIDIAHSIVSAYLFYYLLFVVIIVAVLMGIILTIEGRIHRKVEKRWWPEKKEPVLTVEEKPKEEQKSEEKIKPSPVSHSSDIVKNFALVEKKEEKRRVAKRKRQQKKEKPFREKVKDHKKRK